MAETRISWATHSWNPIVGCTRVSKGCDHCYAITEAWRIAHNPNPTIAQSYQDMVFRKGNEKLDWSGTVRLLRDRLDEPVKHRRGHRRYFVNSMGDLFHKDVPDAWIDLVMDSITHAPQYWFIILTKRPERLMHYAQTHDMPINTICGTSIEDQRSANTRIPFLLAAPVPYRMLSYEPALAAVDFTQSPFGVDAFARGIDWVVCGGESGKEARPCHLDWIRGMMQQCAEVEIPCFVKQLGDCTVDGKASEETDGSLLSWERTYAWKKHGGSAMEEWPEEFRCQPFPYFLSVSSDEDGEVISPSVRT